MAHEVDWETLEKNGFVSFDYGRRTGWTVQALARWVAECQDKVRHYQGRRFLYWGTPVVIDKVLFTEPGLVSQWVIRYEEGSCHTEAGDRCIIRAQYVSEAHWL